MAASGVRPPRPGTVQLGRLEPGDRYDLEPGADIEGRRFADLDVGGQDATAARFSECAFERVVLDETRLANARFSGSALTGVTASLLPAAGSVWRNVVVLGSRFGAFDGDDAELNGVRFEECKISSLSLSRAVVRHVEFVDCEITDLVLADARVDRVAFTRSRISLLDTRRARFTDVDLRGASISAARGLEGLGGSVMHTEQLVDLTRSVAAELRIHLVDRD